MRVLITGAAGFVGSFVVKHILENTDWEVVGLERLSYSGSLDRLKVNLSRYTSVLHNLQSDINDHVAKEIGYVDYIIHIAANSHVDRSIENPRQFVLDNVLGTCNILEFARSVRQTLKRFIYFSTDEVFGPAPVGVYYDDDARYNSTNPYSATKAGGEELAVAYRNTYNIPVIITHTMNIFGETQHPEKFIPKCISKIQKGETIEIHSDSTKTVAGSRFYIYAGDVAEAILFLIHNGKLEKYNIVGKQEIDNFELATMIANLLNKPLKYEFVDFHSSRPGHDLRYALSDAKMKALGWEPKVGLKERLELMVK